MNFGSVDISLTPSPDGVRDVTVLSQALGRRADLSLYAPPGHENDPGLPIVILLHGVFGSHWGWVRNGLAHTILNDLVVMGRVQPVILAMPSDGLFGVGSGYLARPGEDAERWIVEEVTEATRLVFPTCDATAVSIAGLSMGGWGALRLAGRFPRRFQSALGISPLTHLTQVARYAPEELRSAHAADVENADLADLLVSRTGELPPVRISCGGSDDLLESVRTLHRILDLAGVQHQYSEAEGGHEWEYWRSEIELALLFIDAARQAGASEIKHG